MPGKGKRKRKAISKAVDTRNVVPDDAKTSSLKQDVLNPNSSPTKVAQALSTISQLTLASPGSYKAFAHVPVLMKILSVVSGYKKIPKIKIQHVLSAVGCLNNLCQQDAQDPAGKSIFSELLLEHCGFLNIAKTFILASVEVIVTEVKEESKTKARTRQKLGSSVKELVSVLGGCCAAFENAAQAVCSDTNYDLLLAMLKLSTPTATPGNNNTELQLEVLIALTTLSDNNPSFVKFVAHNTLANEIQLHMKQWLQPQLSSGINTCGACIFLNVFQMTGLPQNDPQTQATFAACAEIIATKALSSDIGVASTTLVKSLKAAYVEFATYMSANHPTLNMQSVESAQAVSMWTQQYQYPHVTPYKHGLKAAQYALEQLTNVFVFEGEEAEDTKTNISPVDAIFVSNAQQILMQVLTLVNIPVAEISTALSDPNLFPEPLLLSEILTTLRGVQSAALTCAANIVGFLSPQRLQQLQSSVDQLNFNTMAQACFVLTESYNGKRMQAHALSGASNLLWQILRKNLTQNNNQVSKQQIGAILQVLKVDNVAATEESRINAIGVLTQAGIANPELNFLVGMSFCQLLSLFVANKNGHVTGEMVCIIIDGIFEIYGEDNVHTTNINSIKLLQVLMATHAAMLQVGQAYLQSLFPPVQERFGDCLVNLKGFLDYKPAHV
jgi:hypothetical protein